VLPVLFGMSWRGELAAELERDPLGPATLVRARRLPASHEAVIVQIIALMTGAWPSPPRYKR